MTVLVTLAAVAALWLVARRFVGFAAQSVADYAGTRPAFDIRRQLSGPIVSEGVIFGPTGRVTSRFVAEMRGEWSGDTGTLEERFRFASGGTQERKWHLEMIGDGRFRATADDIIGIGSGEQRDGVVRLRYRIRLPQEAGGHVLDVTDWLYLMENGTMMNRSEMRKFGIKVAELIATMRPLA
jgi:hypothetical protein